MLEILSDYMTIMDNFFHRLCTDGVDALYSKSAEVFTVAEDNQLWEQGVLGSGDPKSLLRTDPGRYQYTEHVLQYCTLYFSALHSLL